MSVLQGEEYITCFDCRAYLREYFSSPFGSTDEKGAQNFQLAQENNFYAKYSAKWDKRNARVLEFGGGPVIKTSSVLHPLYRRLCSLLTLRVNAGR